MRYKDEKGNIPGDQTAVGGTIPAKLGESPKSILPTLEKILDKLINKRLQYNLGRYIGINTPTYREWEL